MVRAKAMTATLTNKSVAEDTFYNLEGTIQGNVSIEVIENAGADKADSRLPGALSQEGVYSHEDTPEKPNLVAENAL